MCLLWDYTTENAIVMSLDGTTAKLSAVQSQVDGRVFGSTALTELRNSGP
jgi:hypothetical protein